MPHLVFTVIIFSWTPVAILQDHNGWSQEVVQRYPTEVLRMDPLPWGAFVAPEFRKAQLKPPEPDEHQLDS